MRKFTSFWLEIACRHIGLNSHFFERYLQNCHFNVQDMYLKELRLWNFRQYGIKGDIFATAAPGLSITFNDGINVLIGENDSGKTTVIDAIRYALRTQSGEFIEFEERDFHQKKGVARETEFKIECTFDGISDAEAGKFLEWVGFNSKGKYELKLWLYAKITEDNRIQPRVQAGFGKEGSYLEGDARDLLRVIYLKPLRDALAEMTGGKRSRLAQVLRSLDAFRRTKSGSSFKEHQLEESFNKYKKEVDQFFEEGAGIKVISTINGFLKDDFLFESEERSALISIGENELIDILQQLNLILEPNKSGLGSLNLLFIAAELLQLREQKGLKLTLIEELEAHLHPQYQLRVLDFIKNNKIEYGQFILSTHSPILASKVSLEDLILCCKGKLFSMRKGHTQLSDHDYRFLQRFLDSTKANLFFAKGVILVEGPSEELLLPAIADLIDRPLHKYGVSIVNVSSRAFLRFARIFQRKKACDTEDAAEEVEEEKWIPIPVSVVTDLDVPSFEYDQELKLEAQRKTLILSDELLAKLISFDQEIDFKEMSGKRFHSLAKFLEEANENKKGKRLKKGTSAGIKAIVEPEFSSITEDDIKEIRRKRSEELEAGINNQNVKAFISPNWTLEYEIALSDLHPLLKSAIEWANTVEKEPTEVEGAIPNEEADFETEQEDTVAVEEEEEQEEEGEDKAPSDENSAENEQEFKKQRAYKLFAPIRKKNVSKAIVAQILAELLSKHPDDWQEIVLSDPQLDYLIQAIYHVTSQPTAVISTEIEIEGHSEFDDSRVELEESGKEAAL